MKLLKPIAFSIMKNEANGESTNITLERVLFRSVSRFRLMLSLLFKESIGSSISSIAIIYAKAMIDIAIRLKCTYAAPYKSPCFSLFPL